MSKQRTSWLVLLVLLLPGAPSLAQDPNQQPEPAQSAPEVEESSEVDERPQLAAASDQRLPEASVTRHELNIDGGTVSFTATAGALTLTSARNQVEAEIGYIAYERATEEPVDRPVTFVINGGPGAASAYLHLGALGPWRLPVGDDNIVPSQAVDLLANPQTWLAFTDLVFVDPVGTGFSRLVKPNDRLRRRYLSIDGDVEALAQFVYRWLLDNGRMRSAKFFVGESYGGFRGPLLAEALQSEHGVALRGMILVSPVLDFGWREQPEYAPLPYVSLLPSLAAARMEINGEIAPEALRAVEDYAAGDYLTDLLRGLRDQAAVARIVPRVAAITGLDRDLVERHAGRIDRRTFARAITAADGRIASLYDTGVTSGDPVPERAFAHVHDPVLDALTAPLTSAVLAHYQHTLEWLPQRRYILLNQGVSRAWRWGEGSSQPHSMTALRRVLALDSKLQVLVVHGYTDLVTPYFESELILRQLPDVGPNDRVRQETYPGGHMFYMRPATRRAFRDDAMRMYRQGMD